jgi:hypothetical protein
VGAASAALTEPWIAELTSDAFIPEFLGILAGTDGSSPGDLANTAPAITVDQVSGGTYRLFQPLSQRYYLVAASLVCRRPGIPDHTVLAAKGQRTTFVMRQIAVDGTESGWVPAVGSSASGVLTPGAPPAGTWTPVTTPTALVPGEEQLPMHAAPVAAFADAGSTAAVLGMQAGTDSVRTVFYGYIPVGRRERMIPTIADPVQALKDYNSSSGLPPVNPIADELAARVINPWLALRGTSAGQRKASNISYASLYLILDLADWISKYLPDLYAAIRAGTQLASGSKRRALQQNLDGINVPTSTPGTVTLSKAIADLFSYAALVTGADIAGPSLTYDMTNTNLPVLANPQAAADGWLSSLTEPDCLYQVAEAALAEEPQPSPLSVPPELQGLIKDDPTYLPPGTPQTTYVIRTVLTHKPCRDVLSAPSHPFVLARATDADAPARKIRIQLPDVSNLRQFKRGVALEMPPSLQRITNRLNPGMLKGDPMGPDGGLQLGMICSFSIQITFILAFVVMFIFLLLLNIVFWWVAFFKICFPIPVKRSSPKGPPL